MDIAVGISLLTCLEAEIYVMLFLLPVNGHHLLFPPYPSLKIVEFLQVDN